MPLGDERLVSPISLSDGTLLFMYYKYPLRQAFGGVLAEPAVVLHEGGEYRVRYESRDGEGRDRLEGARPIVTRDWKRSKWLNEFLIGLDELRLMASLGGRGGPEHELYAILSDPGYREHLACYASKFPDESGSRLIVLNWVGPLAKPVTDDVVPLARKTRAAAVPTAAPRINVEAAAMPKERPSRVVPLAHQVSPAPPVPSVETRQDSAAPVSVEDAGTQKLNLGLDSTQPVSIQELTSPAANDLPEAAEQPSAGPPMSKTPSGPPAAPPVEFEPTATQRTRAERPAIDLPSTVVPLAHQVNPATVVPLAHQASPAQPAPPVDPSPTVEPFREAAVPLPVEGQRSILPPGALRIAAAPVRPASAGRKSTAEARVGRSSSLPPAWLIAGFALFGFILLLGGWWFRGASEQAAIALSAPAPGAIEAAAVSSDSADPQLDRREPPETQEMSTADSLAAGEEAPINPALGNETPGKVTPDAPAPQVDETPPIAEPDRGRNPSRNAREQPEKVARNSEPPVSPDRQRSPPAPVAIESPLLAQGNPIVESPEAASVQDLGSKSPGEPSTGSSASAPETGEVAVPASPPPGPAVVEQAVPTLKITSAQMSTAQRNYLARVIKFLQPPLKYEWIPKYTRPAFFATLVTDGEPPECRIDFKEPTTISFDLVIRGGSGTESRIENVEVIY